MATRDIRGAVSLINSTAFPASWSWTYVTPVIFPPGRARLATSPLATGSLLTTTTIGMVCRCFLDDRGLFAPKRKNHVRIEPHQFVGCLRKPFVTSFGVAVLDDDGLSVDVA